MSRLMTLYAGPHAGTGRGYLSLADDSNQKGPAKATPNKVQPLLPPPTPHEKKKGPNPNPPKP
jgi:hypothetical protein